MLGNGNYTNTISNSGAIVYSSSANQTFSTITGAGGQTLLQNGPGTLTLAGSIDNAYLNLIVNAGTTILSKGTVSSGHDAVALNTTINGGLVQIAGTNINSYQFFQSPTVNGGTLDLNGNSLTAYSSSSTLALSGSAAYFINSNAVNSAAWGSPVSLAGVGNPSIGGAGNLAISGSISGANGFTKIGAGTLTFTAANTYTGATSVNAGLLLLNSAALSTSSPVSVATGSAVRRQRQRGHG